MGGPPIPAALPAIAPENPPNDATAQSKESLSTTPAARSGYAPHIPLSARRDEPLDFSNISTKSQLKVARRDATKIRPYGLQEAPTFRPTEEDFQNPMQYIQKIRSEGSRYGIIKIVPPASWDPPFAIDTKVRFCTESKSIRVGGGWRRAGIGSANFSQRFHFRTRKQELNSVEGGKMRSIVHATTILMGLNLGTRTNLNYMDQLAKFHKQRGYNLNRFPSVDKRPLDLYKLKKAVESRGGFERVCKHKKWAEIGRDLGYSGKIMSSLSTSLKNSYSKWLQPYEEFLAYAKPGVQQQLEHEQGGPFTPPPGVSPMGQPPLGTPMPYHSTPPAYHTSSALHAHINGYEKSPNAPIPKSESSPKLEPPPPPKQAPPPGPVSSGFTPVNPGGFTAVNMTPASFHTAGMPQQMEARGPPPLNILPPQINGTHVQSLPPAPNFLPTSQPVPNAFHHGGYPNPLKRAISHDGMNGFPSNDVRQSGLDDDDEGRRSKRVKKAAPTVVGSHMSTLKPSTPKVIMKPKQHPTKPGEVCEACGKSEDRPTFLICDSCDCGYHGQCLDPPVQAPHPFEWHCPRCLVGTGEFGFEEGGTYSLRQFREKADTFKNTYFSQTRPPDTEPKEKPLVSEEDVEKEFWRLVESVTEVVEVEYGADIHSTTHGSGFPTVERNPLDPYSHDWWNLNILPLHHDSLFRHIKTDISGMTVPWLYVGMCFSTFCWHNEDHYAYSANFQHFGDTKTWYGIPGEDAESFEQAMKAAVPELFESQPDLLFQLVTLLPPDQLKKAGVNVYALDQRAGEIVITFPQAYHAGFNHGFNFNEAVNFAPFDWEPFGAAGVERLQEFRKSPCFSHDELLMTAASSRDTSIKTAKWLAPALERMRDHELSQRNGFLERHHKARLHHCPIDERGDANEICSLNFRVDDQDASEAEQQCSFCKCYTFLSRFQCHKTSQTMCLSHAGVHKCCEGTEEQILTDPDHTLIYRMTDSLLSSSVQKISEKARAPEVWNEKLEQVLDNEPKPALKALRTLVNEGERIPWKLDRLDDLKSFVDRCNRWVEEALSYTVRKQQNRRKNDRVWKKGKNDKGDKGADAGEREREHRKVENIHRLLAEASEISFDCPEIEHLEDRAKSISDFQSRASDALGRVDLQSVEGLEELMEEGKLFNLDIPELGKLEKILQQMRWNEDARERVKKRQTLEEVLSAIQKGNEIGIPEDNALLKQLQSQKSDGEGWEVKVKELMAAEIVHFPQLEALEGHAEDPKNLLPVSPMTMAEVRRVLSKHKEAREQIKAMYDKSKEPSIRDRPKYKDVRDIIQELADLNSKPQGTLDLEKELRRHEDWMRTGKKLFGKANAPLHILLVHMKYVKEHNDYCFDIHDVPRMPVEPASRSPTPDPENSDIIDGGASKKETFCICRRSENGVMVECEICHEW